jgi:3-deoxy-D-manno-octulosonic-acid transferase
MNARTAQFFYNLFFPFALLLMLPRLMLRMMRRGNFRDKFGQRFARYDAVVRARLADGGRVWVHSISVGETFVALKLAQKMKALDPSLKVVLSATTSTGFAQADKHASDWLEVIYNPLDALPFVKRALELVRPSELVFIEAMWPNLLLAVKARGIPVAMIPRLSQRSERRFKKFRFFTGGFFGAFDCLCAQEAGDVPRLVAVGADAEKIHVTQSIKFDHADDDAAGPSRAEEFRGLLRKLGLDDESPILLAGSTFSGEEKTLAEIYLRLRKKFPALFLILVPRHIERTPDILAELGPLGLRIALRDGKKVAPADCLIVNTTGELRDWYHTATVVFIGKSLAAYGGQNPVEAVVAGKPVVFGSHMENFTAVVQPLLDQRAAVQVADAAGLENEIARLLAQPQLRATMAAQAKEAITIHRGATERAAILLLQLRSRRA